MVKRISTLRLMAAWLGALLGLSLLPVAVHAQSEGTVTYRIEPGDTLISLQERFLLGRGAYQRVARLNRIANPRRIPVGTVITVPRSLLAYRPASLTIYDFTGPVTIDGAPAQPNQIVGEGSVVRTGQDGFVSFEAERGGTIAIPSNTHAQLVTSRIYRLRNMRDVEFRVLSGRSSVTAPALQEGEVWNTSTPVAVTAVRGTEYRVGYLEDIGRSVTEVLEGSVDVASGDEESIASEGFGITASENGLGAVEELLPPAEIVDGTSTQTGEDVTFTIVPPDGAVAVRTQIARDAGFLEMVASEISDGDVTFTDLPNGNYNVRSRGISADGLEGLAEASNFRRKRLGATPSIEPSFIEDGVRFRWSAQGEGVIHFAFQLWREGESDTPLIDEIALPGSATVVTGLETGRYIWRVAAVQADPEDGLLKVWGAETPLNYSAE